MISARMLQQLAAGLPGVLMFINGLGFILTPDSAVTSLGMELMNDVGRSTQLADLGAFFFGTAIFIFLGAWRMSPAWLGAGALMLGLAGILRIIAWAVNDAALAVPFIVIEFVFTLWLAGFAWQFHRIHRRAERA